jgi:hypothetical protein
MSQARACAIDAVTGARFGLRIGLLVGLLTFGSTWLALLVGGLLIGALSRVVSGTNECSRLARTPPRPLTATTSTATLVVGSRPRLAYAKN